MFFIAPDKASALSGVFYGVEFESKKEKKLLFLFVLSSLIRTSDYVEGTCVRK